MRSVNRVSLIGHLTHDPNVMQTKDGVTMASFSLATNRRYRNDNDEWVEIPDYHRLIAWRGLADVCANYLQKGMPVYVEGRLSTGNWKDKDGNQKERQEVVVTSLNILRLKGNQIQAEELLGEEDKKTFKKAKRSKKGAVCADCDIRKADIAEADIAEPNAV